MGLFSRKKDKKDKWWKSDEGVELQQAFGTKFKVITGFMVVFIVGLAMIGLSLFLKNSAGKSLFETFEFGGIAVTVAGLVGLAISIGLKIKDDRIKRNAIQKDKLKEWEEMQTQAEFELKKRKEEEEEKKFQEKLSREKAKKNK